MLERAPKFSVIQKPVSVQKHCGRDPLLTLEVDQYQARVQRVLSLRLRQHQQGQLSFSRQTALSGGPYLFPDALPPVDLEVDAEVRILVAVRKLGLGNVPVVRSKVVRARPELEVNDLMHGRLSSWSTFAPNLKRPGRARDLALTTNEKDNVAFEKT